jgi:serine/threonine protein kinase
VTVASGAAGDQFPTASDQPGATFGPYRLVQWIGEGGFGVVWRARQAEPLMREVALKVIKPGMDTRQVLARFKAERQALAMMDHPGIAKVFDAGSTPNGRPYFVMELVDGIPITLYCQRHRLETPLRLRLFMEVCGAVQHAHQKGIIHRDLKPSNVLVSEQDGEPVPKIIDFGIAKATEAELAERTDFTRLEQFLGTPAYMSPEQATLGVQDIDTRSDLYSLGVLLYELLTARPPFDVKELTKVGYDEMRRVIIEVDPPKPSTRLRTLGSEERDELVSCHRCKPEKLNRMVSGDLDWIVMKALEKDRDRRYETVNALAMDLARFLDH